jgi:catechol 2,3-dioxygenase-like lactoylglutathione lyase family enzyme
MAAAKMACPPSTEKTMKIRYRFIAVFVGTLLLWGRSVEALELVGIDHFAINVQDVQKSADWYARVFGFTVLHKWDNAWMIGRGNIKIGLFIEPAAKPLPDLDSQRVIRKIAFLVDGDKFVDTIKELQAKEISIIQTEDTGIAYSVFIKDPDGYLLEFTTFHGNGPPPGLQQ